MSNLEHLIAAYFYEDWNETEYSSWPEAVDDFLLRSPDLAAGTLAEIDLLLLSADQEALKEQLQSWGFAYLPPEGETAWLVAVREWISKRCLIPMTVDEQYPALSQFLGAYLHQDWADVYPSPLEALLDQLKDGPDVAWMLARDVRRLLDLSHDDAALDGTVLELGSYYLPSLQGASTREWLQQLHRLLEPQTPSEALMHALVAEFQDLWPSMLEHWEDHDGELLPYLLMYDVVQWAARESTARPALVSSLMAWLENQFHRGDDDLQNLIAVGFVEMLPSTPEGDPVLGLLGPTLRTIADEMGLFLPPDLPG